MRHVVYIVEVKMASKYDFRHPNISSLVSTCFMFSLFPFLFLPSLILHPPHIYESSPRMSLFEAGSSEGGMAKLAGSADHNMNSPAEGKAQHFPFSSFPPFPFLPRETHDPLRINLTGALPAEESEDSTTSSPNSGKRRKRGRSNKSLSAFNL